MAATAEGLNPEKYIEDRLKQYQSWYDRKAVLCKSRYLRMRGFSVVGGAIVPVLINIDGALTYHGFPIVKGIVTIVSLLVVISVSLETVLHYREQWKNYRSTEQQLGHEQMMYLNRVGRYKGLGAQEAFLTFVERVEEQIAMENAATLNVMTVASEATSESRSGK